MSLENFDGGDAKDQNYVKGAKKRHDETPKKIQLDQFGQELLDAETHCNQLKAELQQFRKELPSLFKETTDAAPITSSPRVEERKVQMPVKEIQRSPKASPVRQSSQFITTDTTGTAVLTINNILNGITDSVNRLSQINSHFGSNSYNKPVQDPSQFLFEPDGSNHSVIEEIPVSNPGVQIKPKETSKAKPKQKPDVAQDSVLTLHTKQKKTVKVATKRAEKKTAFASTRMSSLLKDSKSTVVSKRRKLGTVTVSPKNVLNRHIDRFDVNRQTRPNEKLVELYHNKALKNSDSDDEDEKRRKRKVGKTQPRQKAGGEMVPPLDIHQDRKIKSYNFKEVEDGGGKPDYQEPVAPRTHCSMMSRSYEMPTIASKLKEVAKSYLQAFNFQTIPFCPAQSTSPSHNIGINIQQVLHIIKTKQSVCTISPTLAHNIGLAAEKLNSQPLHTLMSTLSSKMTRSHCPLLKSSMNYQQLQEMAKEVPEEEELQFDEGQGDSLNNNRMQITCSEEPTKDVPDNKNQLVWTVDKNKQMQCICLPNRGASLRQVLSKYSNAHTNYSLINCQNLQQQPNNTPASVVSKFKLPKVPTYKRLHRIRERNLVKPIKVASLQQNTILSENAKKKKTLKEVLQHLHDEFDALNKRYENLSQEVNDNKAEANNDTLKELEMIEKELASKEEEINMVVTLYKEVSALKEQVKNLKKKASQPAVAANPVKQVNSNMANSQAALARI